VTTLESGVPGITMVHGDHVCAFYHGGSQRDEVLVPYLRAAVAAAEPAIAVVDTISPAQLRAAVSPSAAVPSLRVLSPQDAYLVDGRFDTDRMLAFWDENVGAVLREGAGGARAVGEMTWSTRGAPGSEQLLDYEARLNDYLPRYPQMILCLYDLQQFSGAVVMGMLSTHPKVLLNGTVRVNPYYIPPDEFFRR
jgi:hypothetical protein